METMNAQISKTNTLNELTELLNRFESLDSDDDQQEYKNIDLSNLPVFGGEEPDDTEGVYSWDEENVMIPGNSGWEIVSREEYFQ